MLFRSHASTCFKRGITFLPRDVQRRISAYNAKFGDAPSKDKSPNPHKSYHTLTPPEHREPPTIQTPKSTTIDQTAPPGPTISSLDPILPTNHNIEEILDTELGKDHVPVINALNHNDHSSPTIASVTMINSSRPSPSTHSTFSYDPFLQPIINTDGSVEVQYLTEFQNTILNTYPVTLYTSIRHAIYHLDSGANVHASNSRDDFIIFHPIKTNIQLAVGSKAQCQGIGANSPQHQSVPVLLPIG